ncbi:MAG: hypothetical protein WC851_01430 [Candidatus Shapirobacteria bacterium]|jgi:hypothetical protein
MIIKSYEELLVGRDILDKLLLQLGIQINRADRVHLAYGHLENLIKLANSPELKKRYLLENSEKNEVYYSLNEIMELDNILKNINPNRQDGRILKSKFEILLSGPLLPTEENNKNNQPRNALFELSLLADMESRGFYCKLYDPNPDIVVQANGKSYCIECKRIFSNNGLDRAINDAKNQLVKTLYIHKKSRGIIAISITRAFTNGSKNIKTPNENTVNEFLSDELRKFVDSNKNLWEKVKNNKIIAIILHISAYVVFKEDLPMSWSRYLVITNIHDKDPKFKSLYKDFSKLDYLSS